MRLVINRVVNEDRRTRTSRLQIPQKVVRYWPLKETWIPLTNTEKCERVLWQDQNSHTSALGASWGNSSLFRMSSRSDANGQVHKVMVNRFRKMVTIESVLSVLWCDDGKEVRVVLVQNCLSPPSQRTPTHAPQTLLCCPPGPWLLEDFREYSSEDEPAQSDDPALLVEELPSGRNRLLLSCVPVGGLSPVAVQCRAMQVGCQ